MVVALADAVTAVAVRQLVDQVGVADEDAGAEIRACEFPRIKGGKPFNVRKGSFRKMLAEIGQPKPRKKRTAK